MDPLSLSELTEMIKETIDESFSNYYLVVAEISQINTNYSGHSYLQLVEKQKDTDKVIANMRAMIWAFKNRIIQDNFEMVTGSVLKEGIKILATVEVNFHQVYGMGLVIHDIDPTYTVGDIEKRRQEIIDRLKEDGIFDMNKNLEFPLVPQKIAIVSSATAAGLDDFLNHITNNDYGYKFEHKLFEAVMQGDKTEESIIRALDNIFKEIENFEVVVIIRGGGSKLDLSAFDSYNIAQNIAQFPLPVLTGIGHQRDLSIADLVAHKSLKTPTAVADFLVNKIYDFDTEITSKFEQITAYVQNKIDEEKFVIEKLFNRLKNETISYVYESKTKLFQKNQNLKYSAKNFILSNIETIKTKKTELKNKAEKMMFLKSQEIDNKNNVLKNDVKALFIKKENELKIMASKIDAHNPQHILDLGFSITRKNGKSVKSDIELTKGDEILTQLKDGVVISIVE